MQFAQISVVSGIQEELIELVKKKLLESIELQQFIVGRDIEFQEKYIASLTDGLSRYNNHNELEEIRNEKLSSEERHFELESARNKLNGLRIQNSNFGRREQKVCSFLSSGFEQVRILSSTAAHDEIRYKVNNASWICSINNSLALQKIKLICEKFIELKKKVEITFWSSEIVTLLEKLDQQQKNVAFGMIIEIATWEYENSNNRNLLKLINALLDNDETKKEVLVNCENLFSVETPQIEKCLANLNILVALLLNISLENRIYKEKLEQSICQLIARIFGNRKFRSSHMMSIIEVLETVERKFGRFSGKFDNMLSLLESRSHMLERSEQHRVINLIRSRSSHSPIPPEILASAYSSGASIRNVTVIEHSQSAPNYFPHRTRDEIKREVQMEYERRWRIEEEERLEEIRRKKEEERKKKEEEDEKRRKAEESERVRKLKEEEKRKRVLEEEMEMKRKNEEAKIKLEAEMREKAEQAEIKRREEKSRALKKLQKEETNKMEQMNNCTFLQNVPLFRHLHPSGSYSERMLDGKVIGLYYSGYWCQPSRDFTPILAQFYSQVDKNFEILFISSDRSEQEMNYYLQSSHGDWFHLPFDSPISKHLQQFNTKNAIPTLIIIKPNGTVITVDGRDQVSSFLNNPQALVNHWKSV